MQTSLSGPSRLHSRRNSALCTSYSICPGQTTGFPAVLITFSPWWRRPAASKGLDLDPSVSTAVLAADEQVSCALLTM